MVLDMDVPRKMRAFQRRIQDFLKGEVGWHLFFAFF